MQQDIIKEALENIDDYHPLVSRKLKLAIDQLEKSDETEEWQQTGILVRDAWIEFAQKLWVDRGSDEEVDIGANDVKTMLRAVIRDDEIFKLTCSVFKLALKIQHDRNVFGGIARWCVFMTALSMEMLLNLLRKQGELSKSKYYKCPMCGSIKLSRVTKGVTDFDGFPIPMEYIECKKCGWNIEETGLTSPPFE